ncbi:MAG: hypothetical protein WAQ57_01355 [Candidatus Saccharimonadales bacterium]
MSDYAISLKRTSLLLAALAFTAALLFSNLGIFGLQKVDAANITVRSVTMSSPLVGSSTAGVANSETNGADVTHSFTFDPATSGLVRAIEFEYCTAAAGACTGPTGLDVDTTPAILAQTNEGVPFSNLYSLSVGLSSNNVATFTNATGNSLTAGSGGTIVFNFDDVTNPTSAGTFFVRITTFSDATATVAVDDGIVAGSITTGIAITTKVSETLGFSTTADDAGDPAETAACVPLTGSGALAIGDANNTLSIATTYDEFSAFRLYTNAGNGAVVSYRGSTLTKAPLADDITAIGAAAVSSAPGTEQFGLAVDPNGGIFTDDTGGFGGANQLALVAAYNDGDGTITSGGTASFAFVANALTTIASSTAPISCDTGAIRYIANISPLTAAGTYTTTVVYYGVPTF